MLKKAYEDVRLQCHVEGLPTSVTVQSVTWERHGVRIVTIENRFKVEVDPSNLNTTLTVFSVRKYSYLLSSLLSERILLLVFTSLRVYLDRIRYCVRIL